MAGINIQQSTIQELADYLNLIEEAEVTLREEPSTPALLFKAKGNSLPAVSNIDLISQWAAAHKHSTSLLYDGERIVINLFNLYGNE